MTVSPEQLVAIIGSGLAVIGALIYVMRTMVGNLSKAVDAERAERFKLQGKIDGQNELILTAQTKYAAAQARADEQAELLERERGMSDERKRLIQEAQTQIDALKKQVSDVARAHDLKDEQNKIEIARLNDALSKLNIRVENLKHDLKDSEDQKAQLSTQNRLLIQQRDEAMREKHAAEERERAAIERSAEAAKRAQDAEGKLKDAQRQIADLRSRLSQLELQIDDLRTRLTEFEAKTGTGELPALQPPTPVASTVIDGGA